MNIAVPIYFVLTHFWIVAPATPDLKNLVPVEMHADISVRHYQDLEECKADGKDLGEMNQEDPSSLVKEDKKLLANSYFCLPIYIEKDHRA